MIGRVVLSAAVVVFAATASAALASAAPSDHPHASAAALVWKCTKQLHVTAASGGYFDSQGGSVQGNGCWTFDHPTSSTPQQASCDFDADAKVWAYDDTSRAHTNDRARIDACAAAHPLKKGWTGYEYAAYRLGGFVPPIGPATVPFILERSYAQLYGSTLAPRSTIISAWKQQTKAFAPMVSTYWPSGTRASLAALVKALCVRPDVNAIGIYPPSIKNPVWPSPAFADTEQHARRDVIVNTLNECTGNLVASAPAPTPTPGPAAPVNHAPVALHPQSFTVKRGVLARVPLKYSDPDGDPLTLVLVVTDFGVSGFQFKLVPGGFNIVGTATAKTVSFTYRVVDPEGLSAQAHVTVTFTG